MPRARVRIVHFKDRRNQTRGLRIAGNSVNKVTAIPQLWAISNAISFISSHALAMGEPFAAGDLEIRHSPQAAMDKYGAQRVC